MKTATRGLIIILLCGMAALQLWATNRDTDVIVSPTVIVLKSKGPACVTVHANVPIQEVDLNTVRLIVQTRDGATTTLNPEKLFADECGELVAKFDTGEVKGAVKPRQKATFILNLLTLDGAVFSGSCLVNVK